MREYDVRSLPTFVLVDENGKFIDSVSGAFGERAFLNWLDNSTGVLY